MAYTLTRNLKLRLDSNLTANSKYNLERIDGLGATFLVDTQNNLLLRSQTDVQILPENADIGGSGMGGSVVIGTSSQDVSLQIYSEQFNLTSPVGSLDQAVGGTRYLRLAYNSTLNGGVDTAADRTLGIDLDGADRQLVLGGNLRTTGGNLFLTLSADSNLILPIVGTLATLNGVETFTNKSMSGSLNSFSNIPYSSLILTGGIVNADVSNAAAITYNKLNLANSIVNGDIIGSAGIAYSKLNLALSITNGDIANAAAIAGSKINPNFGLQRIITESDIAFMYNGFRTSLRGSTSGTQVADLDWRLPPNYGAGGQVLSTDGNGNFYFQSVGGTGTVTSVGLAAPAEFVVSGSPVVGAGTLTLSKANQNANLVYAGPASGGAAAPTFRALAVADIPVAAIDHNALLNYEANRHIDHTTVSISSAANGGLSGGGDISASRSFSVSVINATSKATPVNNDQVLIADSEASDALKRVTLGSIVSAIAGGGFATDWVTGDGTTKNVTHGLASTDVLVQVFDVATGETITTESLRTDANTVTLTASQAPAATWRVLIKRL